MGTVGRIFRFTFQVAFGFFIPFVALLAFAWVGGTIAPLFGSEPLVGSATALLAGIAVIAAGLHLGWAQGRRGILLGMLLGVALIVLVLGSCYWDATRHY